MSSMGSNALLVLVGRPGHVSKDGAQTFTDSRIRLPQPNAFSSIDIPILAVWRVVAIGHVGSAARTSPRSSTEGQKSMSTTK